MTARSHTAAGPALLATSILLSAAAQLLLKAGMLELHGPNTAGVDAWLRFFEPAAVWVAAGLACYAGSMLAWMTVLARYTLSFAYPMLSLSYVLVFVAAAVWPRLNESFSPTKAAAIALIVAGVVLVSAGDRHSPAQPARG